VLLTVKIEISIKKLVHFLPLLSSLRWCLVSMGFLVSEGVSF
jgi:hypothetical protein